MGAFTSTVVYLFLLFYVTRTHQGPPGTGLRKGVNPLSPTNLLVEEGLRTPVPEGTVDTDPTRRRGNRSSSESGDVTTTPNRYRKKRTRNPEETVDVDLIPRT